MLKIDKEKYRRIAQSQGAQAALTVMHHDQAVFEFQTFEGEKGYQPEMWNDLAEMREFQRELWDEATRNLPDPALRNPST